MREEFGERDADGGELLRHNRLGREPRESIRLEVVDALRSNDEIAPRVVAQL